MAFLKRNLIVIVMGLLVLAIFVALIFLQRPSNGPKMESLNEAGIAEHTYARGLPIAPVNVTLFVDFTDEISRQALNTTETLYNQYPHVVQFAVRHFPQSKAAVNAATATQIAGEQNEFWSYIGKLVTNPPKEFDNNTLINIAQALGLDTKTFEMYLTDKSFETLIEKDIQAGKSLGVETTPTIFLNGKKVEFTSIAALKNTLEEKIKAYISKQETATQDTTLKVYKPIAPTFNQENRTAILEIVYTKTGWQPESIAGYAGQKVRWINTTDKDIFIEQLDKKFPEFETPQKVPAGGTLEFTLYKDKLWRYQEVESKNWGSIFINS